MSVRFLLLFCALAFVAGPMRVAGQTKAGANKSWTVPRAPDGHPDLQGNWVNRSATPLERPKELAGRASLTDAEVAELRRRADRIFRQTRADAPAGDDVFLAALANVEHYKRPAATGTSENLAEREFDNRTSLIIDPPDGRMPAYTAEGQQRLAKVVAATNMQIVPRGPEDLTNFQRCVTWDVPMPRPGPYTSYYQIVQTPHYVMVLLEAIHDARIIPLDRREHLPSNVRTWNGDSIGHWEGDTLVVDTANFSPKSYFMGAAENLHLLERFTRVAVDEIRYEMTVDDPTTWTKAWTATLRLKQTQDKIYEFACHEGNYEIMETMLSPVR